MTEEKTVHDLIKKVEAVGFIYKDLADECVKYAAINTVGYLVTHIETLEFEMMESGLVRKVPDDKEEVSYSSNYEQRQAERRRLGLLIYTAIRSINGSDSEPVYLLGNPHSNRHPLDEYPLKSQAEAAAFHCAMWALRNSN